MDSSVIIALSVFALMAIMAVIVAAVSAVVVVAGVETRADEDPNL